MEQITSKEWFSKLHYSIDKRLSFNTFIERLRTNIAYEYDYIMSAVDYDEMLLDLIQLGEVDIKVLQEVKLKDGDG